MIRILPIISIIILHQLSPASQIQTITQMKTGRRFSLFIDIFTNAKMHKFTNSQIYKIQPNNQETIFSITDLFWLKLFATMPHTNEEINCALSLKLTYLNVYIHRHRGRKFNDLSGAKYLGKYFCFSNSSHLGLPNFSITPPPPSDATLRYPQCANRCLFSLTSALLISGRGFSQEVQALPSAGGPVWG